jgi:hypothetical protein
MRKPGKHPRNNKDQQFTLLEALKNLTKLRILPHDQIQDQFTDHHTDMTHIVLEIIVEVDVTCLLHHVVADVVAEDG